MGVTPAVCVAVLVVSLLGVNGKSPRRSLEKSHVLQQIDFPSGLREVIQMDPLKKILRIRAWPKTSSEDSAVAVEAVLDYTLNVAGVFSREANRCYLLENLDEILPAPEWPVEEGSLEQAQDLFDEASDEIQVKEPLSRVSLVEVDGADSSQLPDELQLRCYGLPVAKLASAESTNKRAASLQKAYRYIQQRRHCALGLHKNCRWALNVRWCIITGVSEACFGIL